MSWTKARDIVWTALGVAGLFYVAGSVLYLVANGLLLLTLGALLAFVLSSPVGWLQRRTGLSRGPASSIVYALLLVVLASLGTWGVSALGTQLSALAAALPTLAQDAQERVPALEADVRAFGLTLDLSLLQNQLVNELQRAGATQGIAWAGAIGVTAMNTFLVLILSFYLVVDGSRLGEAAVAVAPVRVKPYLLFAEKTLLRIVGGYLRGQLVMGAIVGTGTFLLCLALGIRYSLVLALLAVFCELMPMIGPAIMGIAVALAGFAQSLQLATAGVALYFAFRTAIVYVIGPRIIHRTVGVHPIATTLGLVLGAKLLGIWGVFFAAPVLGFVFVAIEIIYREVRTYRQTATERDALAESDQSPALSDAA